MRNLLVISLCILLAGVGETSAQTATVATSACTVSGADTVTAGSTASFSISPCTALSWTTSCGTIVAQNGGSVTVNFNSGSCGTATISPVGAASIGAGKSVTILPAPALTSGVPAVTAQAISYNKAPSPLIAASATGGLCEGAYSYQWLSSTDNSTFTPITGATGQNYQPGPLTVTTYFKRRANCSASGTATSGTITVTVSPSLATALVAPAAQAVNYDSIPGSLAIAPPTGASNVGYQWQSASDPAFSTAANIPGANGNTYTPANLTSTTYFRSLMLLNGDTTYSTPVVVSVYPVLTGGSISPASQTIANDSLPAILTCSGFSGGTGAYTFFWYSSTDGITWSPVAGVFTAGYSPGALTTTTWYQVMVTCNGVAVTSNNAVINVTPQ